MSSEKFYIYELWNPIKNEIFYVGKSYHKRRGQDRYHGHLTEARVALNKNLKKNHKINTILKILREGYNVDFRIVFECKDEEVAFQKEIELIKFYGRRDLDTGPLTNLCDGGEGPTGFKAPAWLRKLYSEQRTGEKNSMYGKNHTEESKKQMSKTRKEKFASGENTPTKHSNEWKQHLRENNAGGKKLSRPIHAITPDGNIFMTFESTGKAALYFDGNTGLISSHAIKTTHWILYGYYWRYVDQYDSSENFIEKTKKRILKHTGKKVLQIDPISKEVINIWNNAKEIKEALGVSLAAISQSSKEKKPVRGFFWVYYN